MTTLGQGLDAAFDRIEAIVEDLTKRVYHLEDEVERLSVMAGDVTYGEDEE